MGSEIDEYLIMKFNNHWILNFEIYDIILKFYFEIYLTTEFKALTYFTW